MRIDLQEKINKPFVRAESPLYPATAADPSSGALFGNRQGIVNALVNGLKDLKYPAYAPDTLSAPMTFDEMVAKLQSIEEGVSGVEELPPPSEGGGDDFGGDDFGDFGGGFDDFGDDFGGGFGDDFGDDFGDFGGEGDLEDPAGGGSSGPALSEELMTGMTTVIEVLEDRVFDKNKSDMYYDIHYIRLIWIDPLGQLPEKPIIAFKYDEVEDVLNDTQWKNFYNDAEYRSLKEIFELRLFHSFFVDVSGNPMVTLEEAEKRRQQMIEFEHHLWEF